MKVKRSTKAIIVSYLAIATILLGFVSITHAGSSTTVTPKTFIRAETDRLFHAFVKKANGQMNEFFYIRRPTPLDAQTVIRMNKDTLYMGAVVDTEGGATVTMPLIPEGRYTSIQVLDNDHYVPAVFYKPGTHKLPTDTKYVFIVVRIQLKKANAPEEIKIVNALQDKFKINASSAEPLPPYRWDTKSLDALRFKYEKDSATFNSWKGMQGPRGTANEKIRHIAAASAWGLFPERDATYMNYSGNHDYRVCHTATYKVPENEAFWSLTVYGKDGYMKCENNILNDANVKLNDDGTFTVYFGSKKACGDVPNRLDVTEGWNFLMRVYRPSKSVIDGKYKIPKAKACNEKQAKSNVGKYSTPADFGVSDVAYKVSETDFNIKRSLAKAPVNEWAHQDDVSSVKMQQVIRENQDVIYSSAVVDISRGATLSVPNSNTYHIIEAIDMQNYIVDVIYPGESITVTPNNVTYGNYIYLNMRIRKLPEGKGGIKATHKLQRMAIIDAKSAVPYKTPDIVVDNNTLLKVRTALIKDVQKGKLKDTSNCMGTPYNTVPQAHLYATAYGWGGLGIEDAAYLPINKNLTKVENGKAQPSSITFTPPEIDYNRGGFWSITTYNEEGWLAKDVAAISNLEAVVNKDGSYTIHFNTSGAKNNIETPTPFTAVMRVFVPKPKQGIVQYLKKAHKEFVIK